MSVEVSEQFENTLIRLFNDSAEKAFEEYRLKEDCIPVVNGIICSERFDGLARAIKTGCLLRAKDKVNSTLNPMAICKAEYMDLCSKMYDDFTTEGSEVYEQYHKHAVDYANVALDNMLDVLAMCTLFIAKNPGVDVSSKSGKAALVAYAMEEFKKPSQKE